MDKFERPVLLACLLATVTLIGLAATVPDGASVPAYADSAPTARLAAGVPSEAVRPSAHSAPGGASTRAPGKAPHSAATQTLPGGAPTLLGGGRVPVAHYRT